MRAVRSYWAGWLGLVQRGREEQQLAEELDSHLQMHIDDNLAAGMGPAEARRRALIALGGVDQTKELWRDRRFGAWFEAIVREIRGAWRALRRAPGPSLAIAVTLGSALGLNAAVFAIADGIILRPVNFPDVDRLVVISAVRQGSPDRLGREFIAPAEFVAWRQETTAIDQLTAFTIFDTDFAGAGDPERLQVTAVSGGYFDVIGTPPSLGRGFISDEETFGRHRTAVLSRALWTRRFAADPNVIGRSILLAGEPFQIVGVARDASRFPFGTDLWVPLAFDAETLANRQTRFLSTIGRLKPGVSMATAQAEMTGIMTRLGNRDRDLTDGRGALVQTLAAGLGEDGMGQLFTMLQAAAIVVLLVACTNITNLLAALGAGRQRETAIRFALGASRRRLLGRLYLENALLALLSVPLALLLGAAAIRLFTISLPPRLAATWTIDIDARVVAVTAALGLLAAVVFGLFPAIQARPRLAALKDAGRGQTAAVAPQYVRRALIVAQVALIVPLVMGAAAIWSGTSRLRGGAQGYETENVLTLRLSLPARQYESADARRRFVATLVSRLGAVNGVTHSAIASELPSSGLGAFRSLTVDGRVTVAADAGDQVPYVVVSPHYFATLRIPIVSGRSFTDSDAADGAPVAIVSRALAERSWPGLDPIGRRVRLFRERVTESDPWLTVVGVTGDVIQDWQWGRNVPMVYRPYEQDSVDAFAAAVRVSGDPTLAAAGVRRAVSDVDPERPVLAMMSMNQMLDQRLTGPRQVTFTMAVLSVLALSLATLGLYGVIAHLVARRTHEIGLRLSFGASRAHILRLVVGQAALLICMGVGIGIVLAGFGSRIWAAVLFGIARFDASLLIALVVLVTAIGLLAALVPAWRASATHPAVALRDE